MSSICEVILVCNLIWEREVKIYDVNNVKNGTEEDTHYILIAF